MQDPDLSQADRLISEKKYDEAIQVLTAYINTHPENFDQAQRRLRQIVKIRGDFSSIANELLDTVVNEPDNVEKILSLISQMESLESSLNLNVQTFITRTQDLAQFSFNRNRLVQSLNNGRALVNTGDYQNALSAYAEGMDIYQDEFFSSGYGEIVENRVRQEIGNINDGIASFPAIVRTVNALAAEIVQAAGQIDPNSAAGVSRIGEIYSRLVPAMNQIIALRRVFQTSADYFDEQLAQFQQVDQTIGDRSFLSFSSRLIRDTAGGAVEDGMLGAVEAYWSDVVSRVVDSLAGLAGRSYAAAMTDAANQDYGKAQGEFENAGGYIQYPLALFELWRNFRGTGPELVFFEQPVLADTAADFLGYLSMSRAGTYMAEGMKLGGAFEDSLSTGSIFEGWRQGMVSAEDAMAQERRIREAAGGFLTAADALSTQIAAERTVLENYHAGIEDAETGDLNFPPYINNAVSLIGDLRTRIFNQEHESAIRFYTIANGELEKRLSSRNDEYSEGNRLVQGIPRNDDTGGINVDYYPTEGLAELTRLEQAVTADIQMGTALLGQYRTERQDLFNTRDIRILYNSTQSLFDELESLRTQGRNLAAAARNQAAQAEAIRLDGERLFLEAQNAVARSNFDTARDRLLRAAERFNASLAIQESASLRAVWDTQVVDLGTEINRLENEIVIRNVRELVNTARTSYFAGNFEQAEELLVRAQNRWLVTNTGEDTEVRYWLNVVRGALSLRSGRVIFPTAPLYAEMSQLLSDAKKKYDEGVRFLNASRRAEGIAKFTEARQKIQEVKLMFPVNQEAGILELRIDQMTDRPAFDASFERRFNDAVAGTKRQSLESFAELQNLAEINPRYSGMAAALVQAEIDMGIRPPPADPRALARSNELTAAARQILDANVSSQFEVALRQVEEALILNPNNNQAMITKDQIQTRINGTGVLDSRSEAEYQRAVMELQRGNYLTAMSIVQQLLQNPQNSSSTRILDLQRRIQNLL
jgi:tetratricopeptide (TPR) repeat protein